MNVLINADRVCDDLPVISTLTNLIDLFQKCVILPFMQKPAYKSCCELRQLKQNSYMTHLNHKSYVRCALLLIPVIGQIIVLICNQALTAHEESVEKKLIQKTLDSAKRFVPGNNLISIISNNRNSDPSFAMQSLQSHLPDPSFKLEKINEDRAKIFVFYYENTRERPLVGFTSIFDRYVLKGIAPSAVVIGVENDPYQKYDVNTWKKVNITVQALSRDEPFLLELFKQGKVIFSKKVKLLHDTKALGKSFSFYS